MGSSFFSEDNDYRVCVSRLEFEQLAGSSLLANCNCGLLGVAKPVVDLDIIERWLENSNFWPNNKASYYAEQTIWSLLMARTRAECLGRGYDICSPFPESEDTIMRPLLWWRILVHIVLLARTAVSGEEIRRGGCDAHISKLIVGKDLGIAPDGAGQCTLQKRFGLRFARVSVRCDTAGLSAKSIETLVRHDPPPGGTGWGLLDCSLQNSKI